MAVPDNTRRLTGIALLVATTILWASTFALMKDAMQLISPALLLAWRFTLAGAAVWIASGKFRLPWRSGALLGVILFASYSLQTSALAWIGANRSAFLTGLNVVLVPLLASRLAQVRVPRQTWLACLLAVIGLAVLAGVGSTGIGDGHLVGDAFTLIGAVLFALYVLVLEREAHRFGLMELAAAQLVAVAGASWIWYLTTAPTYAGMIPDSPALWWHLFFLGLVVSSGTIVMQSLGQRFVSATDAALVFSLEPPLAAGFSWVWLGEGLDTNTWVGGSLILVAMILSQIPLPITGRT